MAQSSPLAGKPICRVLLPYEKGGIRDSQWVGIHLVPKEEFRSVLPGSIRDAFWPWNSSINLVAVGAGQVIGAAGCFKERFEGTTIVKASTVAKVQDSGFNRVAFALLLGSYRYMETEGMLVEREPAAPVSNNIVKGLLDSWCLSCEVDITPDLLENHDRGILTYGEARQMWQFAQTSRVVEVDG